MKSHQPQPVLSVDSITKFQRPITQKSKTDLTAQTYETMFELGKDILLKRTNFLNDVVVKEIEESETTDGKLQLKLGSNIIVIDADKMTSANDAEGQSQKREIQTIINWLQRTRFTMADEDSEKQARHLDQIFEYLIKAVTLRDLPHNLQDTSRYHTNPTQAPPMTDSCNLGQSMFEVKSFHLGCCDIMVSRVVPNYDYDDDEDMGAIMSQEEEQSLYYGHDLSQYPVRTDEQFSFKIVDHSPNFASQNDLEDYLMKRFFIGSRSTSFTLYHCLNYLLGTPFFRTINDVAATAFTVFDLPSKSTLDLLNLVDILEYSKKDYFGKFIFKNGCELFNKDNVKVTVSTQKIITSKELYAVYLTERHLGDILDLFGVNDAIIQINNNGFPNYVYLTKIDQTWVLYDPLNNQICSTIETTQISSINWTAFTQCNYIKIIGISTVKGKNEMEKFSQSTQEESSMNSNEEQKEMMANNDVNMIGNQGPFLPIDYDDKGFNNESDLALYTSQNMGDIIEEFTRNHPNLVKPNDEQHQHLSEEIYQCRIVTCPARKNPYPQSNDQRQNQAKQSTQKSPGNTQQRRQITGFPTPNKDGDDDDDDDDPFKRLNDHKFLDAGFTKKMYLFNFQEDQAIIYKMMKRGYRAFLNIYEKMYNSLYNKGPPGNTEGDIDYFTSLSDIFHTRENIIMHDYVGMLYKQQKPSQEQETKESKDIKAFHFGRNLNKFNQIHNNIRLHLRLMTDTQIRSDIEEILKKLHSYYPAYWQLIFRQELFFTGKYCNNPRVMYRQVYSAQENYDAMASDPPLNTSRHGQLKPYIKHIQDTMFHVERHDTEPKYIRLNQNSGQYITATPKKSIPLGQQTIEHFIKSRLGVQYLEDSNLLPFITIVKKYLMDHNGETLKQIEQMAKGQEYLQNIYWFIMEKGPKPPPRNIDNMYPEWEFNFTQRDRQNYADNIARAKHPSIASQSPSFQQNMRYFNQSQAQQNITSLEENKQPSAHQNLTNQSTDQSFYQGLAEGNQEQQQLPSYLPQLPPLPIAPGHIQFSQQQANFQQEQPFQPPQHPNQNSADESLQNPFMQQMTQPNFQGQSEKQTKRGWVKHQASTTQATQQSSGQIQPPNQMYFTNQFASLHDPITQSFMPTQAPLVMPYQPMQFAPAQPAQIQQIQPPKLPTAFTPVNPSPQGQATQQPVHTQPTAAQFLWSNENRDDQEQQPHNSIGKMLQPSVHQTAQPMPVSSNYQPQFNVPAGLTQQQQLNYQNPTHTILSTQQTQPANVIPPNPNLQVISTQDTQPTQPTLTGPQWEIRTGSWLQDPNVTSSTPPHVSQQLEHMRQTAQRLQEAQQQLPHTNQQSSWLNQQSNQPTALPQQPQQQQHNQQQQNQQQPGNVGRGWPPRK